MKRFKFWLAGWLCRAAVWLRGEEWRVMDAMAGVPGNRVAELRQRLWERCVVLTIEDPVWRYEMDRDLAELAQHAGEA